MVRILLSSRSSSSRRRLFAATYLALAVSKSSTTTLAFAPTSFATTTTTRASSYSSSSSSLQMSSNKQVLVPIGDGSEEIETTCITDTLTRFGADVTIASVMPDLVCTMSRGIKILADTSMDDAAKKEWDLVALPGGMPGAEHLRDSAALKGLLEQQHANKKLFGAVCAAPAVVLATHGLLQDGGMTCYPANAFRSTLKDPVDDPVVVQDHVVTSQGPGTSLLFALALGEQLYGKEKADEIAAQMLVER